MSPKRCLSWLKRVSIFDYSLHAIPYLKKALSAMPHKIFLFFLFFFLSLAPSLVAANGSGVQIPFDQEIQGKSSDTLFNPSDYKSGELLIQGKAILSQADLQFINDPIGAVVIKTFSTLGVSLIQLPRGMSVIQGISYYQKQPTIRFAEPNYISIKKTSTFPNDPRFLESWSLNNLGEPLAEIDRTFVNDADVDAPEAWDINTGQGEIIIAILDTGIDYSHEDLIDNLWINQSEWNGEKNVDDDNNGYVDDIYGINTLSGTGDPMDDDGHGTHVAGIIGAVGNNGIGIAGVSWNVRLMAIKFLDSIEGGSSAATLASYDYVLAMKNRGEAIRILNASFSSTAYSQLEYDALTKLQEAGILIVAASGNTLTDNDQLASFPDSYDLDAIISVAASNPEDGLAYFSDSGMINVDVAAPGDGILSSVPGNEYTPNKDDFLFDDMENGLGEWVSYSSWQIIEDPESLENHLWTNVSINHPIPDDAAILLSKPLNLEDFQNQNLTFGFRSNTEEGDYKWVLEFSNVDGVWISGKASDGLYDDSGWKTHTVIIPHSVLTNSFRFRFRLDVETDEAWKIGQVLLDDIGISTQAGGSNQYDFKSGTSMAAPMVSGLASLLWDIRPEATYQEIKEIILSTVDPLPLLNNKVLSGGRINLHSALIQDPSQLPPLIFSLFRGGDDEQKIILEGKRFGQQTGSIILPSNLQATVVSWTDEKIVFRLPEGDLGFGDLTLNTQTNATARTYWSQDPLYTQHTDLPIHVYRPAVTSIGDTIYVFGGSTKVEWDGVGEPTGLVQIYHTKSDYWTQGTPNTQYLPSDRAVVWDGKIVSIVQESDVLCVYDPQNDGWLESMVLPKKMSGHQIVVLEGALYVMGGTFSLDFEGEIFEPQRTLYRFDKVMGQWLEVSELPDVRSHFGVSVIGGKLYLFGGSETDLEGNTSLVSTMVVFDPVDGSWQQRSKLNTVRRLMGWGSVDGKLYVMGGATLYKEQQSTEVYDPEVDRWQLLESKLFTPLYGMGSVVVDRQVYGIGGRVYHIPLRRVRTNQGLFIESEEDDSVEVNSVLASVASSDSLVGYDGQDDDGGSVGGGCTLKPNQGGGGILILMFICALFRPLKRFKKFMGVQGGPPHGGSRAEPWWGVGRSPTKGGLSYPIIFSSSLLLSLIPSIGGANPLTIQNPKTGFNPHSIERPKQKSYRLGELLVQWNPNITVKKRSDIHKNIGSLVKRDLPNLNMQHILLSDAISVGEALVYYQAKKEIRSAEPNYTSIYPRSNVPNDPRFDELWGFHNNGKTFSTLLQKGLEDADIDAPEAWDYATGGGDVVVAIIDSGIDYTHEDLSDNLWINVMEKNGISGVDDDENGYIDDIYGIDTLSGTGDPMDDQGHGTHVAGIIGAVGNNGVGVSGLNWRVKLMSIKSLPASESGSMDSYLMAYDYILAMKERGENVRVVNVSLGHSVFSQSEYDAIVKLQQSGILLVVAASNEVRDSDQFMDFPSHHSVDSIISVTATGPEDDFSDDYSWGVRTVDVAAPGVKIMSTLPGNEYQPTVGDFLFDDVENGTADWIAQSDWRITTDAEDSENHFWSNESETEQKQDALSMMVSHSLDLSSFADKTPTLGFSMKGSGSVLVEVSGRGGDGWIRSSQFELSEQWDIFSYPLPYSVLTDSFQFRIRSKDKTNPATIHLDLVGIEGEGVGSNQYGYLSGTSMAASMVSGLAALIWDLHPDIHYLDVLDILVSTVDPISDLKGKIRSGGRINASKALSMDPLTVPPIIDSVMQSNVDGEKIILQGRRFGDTKGLLKTPSGQTVTIISWSDHSIVGTWPSELISGDFVLTTSQGDTALYYYRVQQNTTSETDMLYNVYSPTVAAVGDRLFVIGGVDNRSPTGLVQIYNVKRKRWSQGKNKPTPISRGSSTVLDGEIHVVGGGSDEWSIYNPESNTWRQSTPLPYDLHDTRIISLNGELHVLGGYRLTDSGSRKDFSEHYRYDTEAKTWQWVSNMKEPRSDFAVGVINGKIIIAGGSQILAGYWFHLKEGALYDPVKGQWSSIKALNTPRDNMGWAVSNGRLYVMGGTTINNGSWKILGDMEYYDPITDTWTVLDISIKDPTYGPASTSISDSIYMLGGWISSEGASFNSVSFMSDPVEKGSVSIVTSTGNLTIHTHQNNSPIQTPTSVGYPDTVYYEYPFGVYDFTVSDVVPLSTIEVTLTISLPSGESEIPNDAHIRKTNSEGQWQALSNTLGTLDRENKTITLKITDNGPFDLDPDLGSIHDPVGLAVYSGEIPSSGGGGGCSMQPQGQGEFGLILLVLLALIRQCFFNNKLNRTLS